MGGLSGRRAIAKDAMLDCLEASKQPFLLVLSAEYGNVIPQ